MDQSSSLNRPATTSGRRLRRLSLGTEKALLRLLKEARWGWRLEGPYLGGAGVKTSRFWPGSGFGFGFGAFLTSFLPLSLLPMGRSVT